MAQKKKAASGPSQESIKLAIKKHIIRKRQRIKQESIPSLNSTAEIQDVSDDGTPYKNLTPKQVDEQLSKLEKRLEILLGEKRSLFVQLKNVLYNSDKQKEERRTQESKSLEGSNQESVLSNRIVGDQRYIDVGGDEDNNDDEDDDEKRNTRHFNSHDTNDKGDNHRKKIVASFYSYYLDGYQQRNNIRDRERNQVKHSSYHLSSLQDSSKDSRSTSSRTNFRPSRSYTNQQNHHYGNHDNQYNHHHLHQSQQHHPHQHQQHHQEQTPYNPRHHDSHYHHQSHHHRDNRYYHTSPSSNSGKVYHQSGIVKYDYRDKYHKTYKPYYTNYNKR